MVNVQALGYILNDYINAHNTQTYIEEREQSEREKERRELKESEEVKFNLTSKFANKMQRSGLMHA